MGLSAYIAPDQPGFTGILKQRFSDFIVHEINLAGEVCVLRDAPGFFSDPQPTQQAPTVAPDDDGKSANMEAQEPVVASEADLVRAGFAKLVDTLGAEATAAHSSDSYADADAHGSVQLHRAFREHLGRFVETSTVGEVFKKAKTPTPPPAAADAATATTSTTTSQESAPAAAAAPEPAATAAAPQADSNIPDASRMTVAVVPFRENTDNASALSMLSRTLSSSVNLIACAGTKDKRAITTQWCTMFRRTPADLTFFNQQQRGSRPGRLVVVGNVTDADKPYELGHLSGNRFSIVLRNISIPPDVAEAGATVEDVVTAACTTIRNKGFINYFGLQAVLDMLPFFLATERSLMLTLARVNTSAYLPALRALPRHMQLLYLHAAQSYCFNHAVSHRIKTYGPDAPVVGDLVRAKYDDADTLDAAQEGEDGTAAVEDADALADAGELVGDDEGVDAVAEPPTKRIRTDGDSSSAPADGGGGSSRSRPPVHVVTEEDLKEGRYTIFDVVLPVPGVSIMYPKHECGKDYYETVLQTKGLTLCHLLNKECRDYSCGGTYRSLIELPKDVTWDLQSYTDNTQQLMLSDLDEIRAAQAAVAPQQEGQKLRDVPAAAAESSSKAEGAAVPADNGEFSTSTAAEVCAAAAPMQEDQEQQDVPCSDGAPANAIDADGANAGKPTAQVMKALYVSFSLPSSTYATVLLRELTKQCMSTSNQIQLNALPAPGAASTAIAEPDAGAPRAMPVCTGTVVVVALQGSVRSRLAQPERPGKPAPVLMRSRVSAIGCACALRWSWTPVTLMKLMTVCAVSSAPDTSPSTAAAAAADEHDADVDEVLERNDARGVGNISVADINSEDCSGGPTPTELLLPSKQRRPRLLKLLNLRAPGAHQRPGVEQAVHWVGRQQLPLCVDAAAANAVVAVRQLMIEEQTFLLDTNRKSFATSCFEKLIVVLVIAAAAVVLFVLFRGSAIDRERAHSGKGNNVISAKCADNEVCRWRSTPLMPDQWQLGLGGLAPRQRILPMAAECASTMLPLPQTPLLLRKTHMTATSAAAIAAEVASRDDELVDALDAHMGLPFAQVNELHNAAGRAVLHLQASTAMMAIMMATRAVIQLEYVNSSLGHFFHLLNGQQKLEVNQFEHVSTGSNSTIAVYGDPLDV
ncbi:hypothetical protein JKP88DRAFT_267276 [Tribonema minus]|uniref:TRUD domain-containing protein n=1 Tax=Tribonema minus TaxID=303371 RepID=A0A835ZAF9_9STRA|nr:hypothetical protein JKP88DRAFT_267276 [Tribonema minus]